MKKLNITVALLLLLGCIPTNAQQKLDTMIVEGMKDWKILGLATIVIKDGVSSTGLVYGYYPMKGK